VENSGLASVMAEDSSLTHRAYVQIRADLISCRLPPGSRLNISQLQRSLGLSQAAVREALSRLTSENLVIIERHSGFRAAPISTDGYADLAKACLVIEIPCLRSSIANGDLRWEGALLSTYHISSQLLSRVVSGEGTLDSYVGQREEFHRKLFSASDSTWLLWAWSLLYAQQLRYRHRFADLARFEFGLKTENREFLDAVIERDVERAVLIWRHHSDAVTNFIESSQGTDRVY
jgi:GntR family transcriptional regulator, carbon starvation induced regulator